jgi:hypothetical protein
MVRADNEQALRNHEEASQSQAGELSERCKAMQRRGVVMVSVRESGEEIVLKGAG